MKELECRDNASRATGKEIIEREQIQIWRRRLRLELPEISELDIKKNMYTRYVEKNGESISGCTSSLDSNTKAHCTLITNWLSEAISLSDCLLEQPALTCVKDAAIRIRNTAHKLLTHIEFIETETKSTVYKDWEPLISEFKQKLKPLSNPFNDRIIQCKLNNNLVGLALSGGGIRSASFSLGAIEAFHRVGLIDKVDYLSTVSGGGYTGAAWTVNSSRNFKRFPFAKQDGDIDDTRIQWLRAHGSYLSKGKEVNTLTLLSSIAKVIVINFTIIIPLVLFIFFLLNLDFIDFYSKPLLFYGLILLSMPFSAFLFSLYQYLKKRDIPSPYKFSLVTRLTASSLPAILLFLAYPLCILPYQRDVDDIAYYYLMVAVSPLAILSTYRLTDYLFDIHKCAGYRHFSFFFTELGSWICTAGLSLFLGFNMFEVFRVNASLPPAYLICLVIGMVFAAKLFSNCIYMSYLSASAFRFRSNEQRSFSVLFGDLLGFSLFFLALGAIPLIDTGFNLLVTAAQNGDGEASYIGDGWASYAGTLTSVIGALSIAVGWVKRKNDNERNGWIANLLRFGFTLLLITFVLTIYNYIEHIERPETLLKHMQDTEYLVSFRKQPESMPAYFKLPSDTLQLFSETQATPPLPSYAWAVIVLGMISWLLLVMLAKINYMSMHRYYRNRLSDAFLADTQDKNIENLISDSVEIERRAETYLNTFPPQAIEFIMTHMRMSNDRFLTLYDIMRLLNDPLYDAFREQFIQAFGKQDQTGLSRIEPEIFKPLTNSRRCRSTEAIAYLAALSGYNQKQREVVASHSSRCFIEIRKKWSTRLRLLLKDSILSTSAAESFCERLNIKPAGSALAGEFRLVDVDIGLTGAPYPLINANLVLVGSSDPKHKARLGDSFVFTPNYVGSEATQWKPTLISSPSKHHISPCGSMTVATAMAISGAAIDPNTASTRSIPLRIVMALLNVRLGYWWNNPGYFKLDPDNNEFGKPCVDGSIPKRLKKLFHESWLVLIYREMMGLMNENSKHIRLSDGGHFDNLGLYELIRRRCKTIVVCDAGADPKFKFGDLARSVLRARSDFGVKIQIQFDELRPSKNKPAKSSFTEGSVEYPALGELPAMTGKIFLIKTTLFAALNSPDVLAYASSHDSFPDEPTSDQFFNEDQFEAYRQLGNQAASNLSKRLAETLSGGE